MKFYELLYSTSRKPRYKPERDIHGLRKRQEYYENKWWETMDEKYARKAHEIELDIKQIKQENGYTY